MDIRRLDLNLLPVLDALLRHQSVTLAARELDMSQSSVSAALTRLRSSLGDALFVRTGHGVRPTTRALALSEPIAAILNQVRDVVVQGDSFDAGHTHRQFNLCLSDVGSYVMWPTLVKTVRERAPNIGLRLRTLTVDAIPLALESGECDLAIGVYPTFPTSLFQRRLSEREYVCVVKKGHPLARRAPTIKQFVNTQQVVVRTTSGVQERIDQSLDAQGLRRTHTLDVPSFLLLPPLLNTGEYLAVMPGQLADAFSQHLPLVILRMPMALPTSVVRLHWHRRFHQDAGNSWLRQLIVELFAGD